MNWTFIAIPIVSAFVGWIVNRTAIKLLFHPVKPIHILGVTIQCVFPKRKKHLSLQVGKLAGEFFSFSEVEQKIADPENVQKILPVLESHIDTFLKEKLPQKIPMLGMLIGEKTIGQVKRVFIEELEELFPILIKQYLQTLQQDFNIASMVAKKVDEISLNKLESILYNVLLKEYRLVGILGAITGFIIGLIQVAITIAIS